MNARPMPKSLGREPRAGQAVKSTAPCRTCGFVYPWCGDAQQIAAVLRLTGGQCPACVNGYPVPDTTRINTAAVAAFGRLIGVR